MVGWQKNGGLAPTLLLSACVPTAIEAHLSSGSTLKISFYRGGSALDDLMIIDGQNYFGKSEYQMQDPLGDIGFRLNSGERVEAECKVIGKDLSGEDN